MIGVYLSTSSPSKSASSEKLIIINIFMTWGQTITHYSSELLCQMTSKF